MGGSSRCGSAAMVIVVWLCFTGRAAGELRIPRPTDRFVVDRANLIDPGTERKMEAWLAELHQKTTATVIVLTVASTEGEEVVQFAQRMADDWKPGTKGKDNGALIVLAVKERKIHIQTGYGLEGALPDSWCGTLSRAVAKEYFKRGQYAAGLARMAVSVANKVADESNVTLAGMPTIRHSGGTRSGRGVRIGRGRGLIGALFSCVMPLIMMSAVFGSKRRGRNSRGGWRGGGLWQGLLVGSLLSNMMSNGGRSSWGGGGGGFGGFGGGGFGGGSFGGGFGGGGGGASW
ncbi:MAG: TPM domain-containing protein [Planctomycetes bacterium]|nr:TPM domain-containing protein [Planctomycetota bacterium]